MSICATTFSVPIILAGTFMPGMAVFGMTHSVSLTFCKKSGTAISSPINLIFFFLSTLQLHPSLLHSLSSACPQIPDSRACPTKLREYYVSLFPLHIRPGLRPFRTIQVLRNEAPSSRADLQCCPEYAPFRLLCRRNAVLSSPLLHQLYEDAFS